MCARSFLALLLALCLPGASWSDGGYLMDQSSKDESLRILTELDSNLTTLKYALQRATDNATRLDEDLRLSQLRLANSEKLLLTVKLNLDNSEASLAEVKALLAQASQALQDSERSFKDFQRSEVLRMIGVGLVAFAFGVVTGWGLIGWM